ncbi:hypothetical protein [Streptomyces alkaliphilus]|uniref:hypothetical protein n=1 Tax=Streptomyces alkaliphilus TaxID=1472722 RepID=UPI00117DA057|nr:hypothetical protein [Streptomyces alkaliphilus]MQS07779.1 hypothetical protein [Streptomyces alkaliphilus]
MFQWQLICCGAVGAGLIGLGAFYRQVQKKKQWPWAEKNGPTLPLYLAAESCRVLLGAGVAGALAASDQLGVFSAFVVGAGAPAILDTWQRGHPAVPIAPAEATALFPAPRGESPSGERIEMSEEGDTRCP